MTPIDKLVCDCDSHYLAINTLTDILRAGPGSLTVMVTTLISPETNGIYWAGAGDHSVTPLCYHRNNQTRPAGPEIKPSSQGQTGPHTAVSSHFASYSRGH